MKIYVLERDEQGTPHVVAREARYNQKDGTPLYDLSDKPRVLCNHEWAIPDHQDENRLAVEIIMDLTGDERVSEMLHALFRKHFLIGMKAEGGVLRGKVIKDWLGERLSRLGMGHEARNFENSGEP